MLNFSPKIRIGMLINIMFIKHVRLVNLRCEFQILIFIFLRDEFFFILNIMTKSIRQ